MGYGLFAGPSGGAPVAGQPTMIRTWGIPTGPGYRDRPGKWNLLIPPLLLVIKEFLERIKL
jgi:hypothetical protein